MSQQVEVQIDRAELLQAIATDCYLFLSFYLEDELTLEIPDFHVDIWNELLTFVERANHPDFIIGKLRKLFAVPRDHSKSTLAKLAVILFMRYSVFSFTLYVSKTAAIAIAALRDIERWLMSPRDQELYGPATVVQKNQNEGLWILRISVPRRSQQKEIILKGIGQNHQVRGTLINNRRPELAIIDDIEDLDTVNGGTRHDANGPQTQQEKLDEWFLGSLMKALAKRNMVLFIGNMLKSTSLLARLSTDAEWNPTVFGALVRDKVTGKLKPLWEGRWTLEALLKDYHDYRKLGKGHLWEAEMMNICGDRQFQEDLSSTVLIPLPSPEDVTAGFICVDPAFGTKKFNDETAMTVHARVEGYVEPVIVASRKGHWTENQQLDNLIELSNYWNISTWAIEAQAAQRLLIPLFRLLLQERLIPPETYLMIPVTTNEATKASRITAMIKAVVAGSYLIADSEYELKEALEEYSPTQSGRIKDDLADSAAFGPIVWQSHNDTIEARARLHRSRRNKRRSQCLLRLIWITLDSFPPRSSCR